MQKAKFFYMQVIGLNLVREQDDFIVLQKGHAKIHICPSEDMPEYLKMSGFERIGAGVEFCFEIEDVHGAYANAMRSGYPILEPLHDQPWGKTDFRVVDPDGSYVRVTGPRNRPNKCLKT